jgi:hypothetical protein
MRAFILAAALVVSACGSGHDNAAAPENRDAAHPRPTAAVRKGPAKTTISGPKAVLRAYYDAIQKRDYARAWSLWERGRVHDGQSLQQFAAGYADTELTSVEIGEPSRPEGAAGSLYVTVPVVVEDLKSDGSGQRYEGTYTLRRSNLPPSEGGDPNWRLYSGHLEVVPEKAD